jgi:hypothetical protein
VLQAHVAIETNLFREGAFLAEVRRRHAAGLGPDLMLLPGSGTCCTLHMALHLVLNDRFA